MAEAVYLLCSLTSLLCAFSLFRGYLVPDVESRLLRSGVALMALMVLVYGLIEESK